MAEERKIAADLKSQSSIRKWIEDTQKDKKERCGLLLRTILPTGESGPYTVARVYKSVEKDKCEIPEDEFARVRNKVVGDFHTHSTSRAIPSGIDLASCYLNFLMDRKLKYFCIGAKKEISCFSAIEPADKWNEEAIIEDAKKLLEISEKKSPSKEEMENAINITSELFANFFDKESKAIL